MFCKKCGAEMDNEAMFCPKCGAAVNEANNNGYQAPPPQAQAPASTVAADDAPSGGFAFLCFLWPLIGLILYIVWHQNYPQKAKSCGKGAIIGVVVQVIFGIIFGIIYGLLLANAIEGYYALLPLL